MPNFGNITASLQFCDTHIPSVEAGAYQIESSFTLTIGSDPGSPHSYSLQNGFTVAGPRFALEAGLIGTLFPAAGALGDFSSAFPQIPLTRTTLPWERSPYPTGQPQGGAPWLALLVFHPGEAPTVTTITAGDLQTAATASPWHPAYTLEDGQSAVDPVSVIDVPMSVLQGILPNCADLPYTAHVRQALDADGNTLREQAVVVAGRMPASSGLSMAFLVSIEGRYTSSGFDFQSSAAGDLIRLVTLKTWRFSCVEPMQTFSGLMAQLAQGTLAPVVPTTAQGNGSATDRLGQGYVGLPYQVRNGARTAAWYRGPLVGGTVAGTLGAPLPVLSGDGLITFDPATAFFDVTYAAAWTLGRLLMLATPSAANALYAYKLALQQAAQPVPQQYAHLLSALGAAQSAAPSPPPQVTAWFSALATLAGVPFEYLVADDAMLPLESVRFFTLDPNWLAALFDGALAVGRVTGADQLADAAIPVLADISGPVTGFLLRSAVVTGWPDMVVTGYSAVPQDQSDLSAITLPTLRQVLLAGNTLLCLFSGTAQAVDFHPVPEALHAGLDLQNGEFTKTLRTPGTGALDTSLVVKTIPWNPLDQTRSTVSFSAMAAAIAQTLQMTSLPNAQFAMEMIESQSLARLIVTPDGGSQ